MTAFIAAVFAGIWNASIPAGCAASTGGSMVAAVCAATGAASPISSASNALVGIVMPVPFRALPIRPPARRHPNPAPPAARAAACRYGSPRRSLSSARNFSLAAYLVRTTCATSRWRYAVLVRNAFSTSASSRPSSGFTNTVAWRRSGDIRTSVTETMCLASVSSCTSPRCRMADKACRTCSPTRSVRTDLSGVSLFIVSPVPLPPGEGKNHSVRSRISTSNVSR